MVTGVDQPLEAIAGCAMERIQLVTAKEVARIEKKRFMELDLVIVD